MNSKHRNIIKELGLIALPEEGGFYRQTYKSKLVLDSRDSIGGAIYCIVTQEHCSALHKLKCDELYKIKLI